MTSEAVFARTPDTAAGSSSDRPSRSAGAMWLRRVYLVALIVCAIVLWNIHLPVCA